MSRREIIDCDNCGGEGARARGPFNVGLGLFSPDLCETCETAMELPALLAVADEYGAVVETVEAKPTTSGKIKCPMCAGTLTGRTSIIRHLVDQHDKTPADASAMYPPTGAAKACRFCGYLTAAHAITLHEAACPQREEPAA